MASTPVTGGGVTASFIDAGAATSGSIASGSIGQFEIASGAVTSGRIGNAAVVSGSIGSGQVSHFHISSGAITSGQIGSGTVLGQAGLGAFTIASGSIGQFDIGSGQVNSGHIAPTSITSGKIASGAITGFGKSGVVTGTRQIASGSVGGFDMADNAVNSGQLGAEQIGHQHFFRGTVNPGFDATLAYGVGFGNAVILTGQGQMSGGAIAFSTNLSGKLTVVPAERQSGLRLPCVGVMASGAPSGEFALVITQGFVPQNHFIASGFTGQPLYVGSGGFIVTQSGIGGVFSGPLQISGSAVQRIGVCISGGMLVQIDMKVTSGLESTAQGTF